jgi:hypothetical protein
LQTVLVWIYDNGVGLANNVECCARFGAEVISQREITAIGGIDMNPETESLAKRDDFVQRVDGAESRRAQGGNDSPDIPLLKPYFEGCDIYATVFSDRH